MLEIILQLPKTLKNLAQNIITVLFTTIQTDYGEVSLFALLGGGLIVTVLLIEVAKWLLK